MKIKSALFLIAALSVAHSLQAKVPDATIIGPVATQARNSIYNASTIELAANGYIEEEYFIEGRANRYSSPELQNADIEDSDHRYKSRFVVRRPQSAEDFNGIVIIEWLNVTGGSDKDIDWWQSGSHLIRNGYAFVAVSAQGQGIDTIKQWSPERYRTLDVTHAGMVTDDALSYDIFSSVARAVNRSVGNTTAGQPDIMGGLKAELIIATGHSQSASRLATYLNNVHPLDPVFDGFMVHGGGGRIRDDQPVKIFKIMAETDMLRRAATPQPDSNNFRQWEVAGSSHVDLPFELEFAKSRNMHEGLPFDNVAARSPGCNLPGYSRIPFRDVMNAAFEHLVVWIKDGTLPPTAEPIQVAQMMPQLEFARDEYGNVLGGIRLAAHDVATAKNTGMNSGSNQFCFLYGSHEPFDAATLDELYPSHEVYVTKVRAVVEQNLADGYILPYAAELTIRGAEASDIGK